MGTFFIDTQTLLQLYNLKINQRNETFEKCSILLKFKSKIPDFERGKTKILTTGIHVVFRG